MKKESVSRAGACGALLGPRTSEQPNSGWVPPADRSKVCAKEATRPRTAPDRRPPECCSSSWNETLNSNEPHSTAALRLRLPLLVPSTAESTVGTTAVRPERRANRQRPQITAHMLTTP